MEREEADICIPGVLDVTRQQQVELMRLLGSSASCQWLVGSTFKYTSLLQLIRIIATTLYRQSGHV